MDRGRFSRGRKFISRTNTINENEAAGEEEEEEDDSEPQLVAIQGQPFIVDIGPSTPSTFYLRPEESDWDQGSTPFTPHPAGFTDLAIEMVPTTNTVDYAEDIPNLHRLTASPVRSFDNRFVSDYPDQPKSRSIRPWLTPFCGDGSISYFARLHRCLSPWYSPLQIAAALNEHCCTALLPCTAFALQTKFRSIENIEGSLITDFLTLGCGIPILSDLALARLHCEMAKYGYLERKCVFANPVQRPDS